MFLTDSEELPYSTLSAGPNNIVDLTALLAVDLSNRKKVVTVVITVFILVHSPHDDISLPLGYDGFGVWIRSCTVDINRHQSEKNTADLIAAIILGIISYDIGFI